MMKMEKSVTTEAGDKRNYQSNKISETGPVR